MDPIQPTFHNYSNNKVHQYDPLDPTRNEIRLLRLLPARSGASRIRGELFVISLQDDPLQGYEALSYVWGDPAKSADIWIDGKRLGITKNLQLALKDITPKRNEGPLIIWIDAICINQDNAEERGHQVQLMRKIYSNAVCTRAWLDVKVDISSAPFREIETRGTPVVLAAHSTKFWEPVIGVFRNQYWSRIRVQQEMLLASRVVFNLRASLVPDQHILPFLSAVCGGINQVHSTEHVRASEIHSSIGGEWFRNLGIDMVMVLHDKERQNHNYFSLFSLYNRSIALLSHDTRDQLFGLIGIASNISPKDITVDYDLDPLTIFAQIPSLFIQHHNDLAFLCYREPALKSDFAPEKRIVFRHAPTWFPIPGRTDPFAGDPDPWNDKRPPCKPPRLPTIGAAVNITRNGGITLRAKGIKIDLVSRKGHHDDIEDAPIAEWLEDLSTMTPIPACTSGTRYKDDLSLKLSRLDILSDYIFDRSYVYKLFDSKQTLDKLHNATRSKFQSYIDFLSSIPRRTNQENSSIYQLYMGESEFSISPPLDSGIMTEFMLLFRSRQFLLTINHGIGLARSKSDVQIGDEIWLLAGCCVPLILRPREGEPSGHILISQCWVDGWPNYWEALDGMSEDWVPPPGYTGPPVEDVVLW